MIGISSEFESLLHTFC